MSRPKNSSVNGYFAHEKPYVITPTYSTEAELDEAVKKLGKYAGGHIPQRMFLKLLGMRMPAASKEYRNDVLLDTGVKKHVVNEETGVDYWYMQYDVEKTNRPVLDTFATFDLNTHVGWSDVW